MVHNQKDEQVEASVLLEIEQLAKKESEVTKSFGISEVGSDSLA
jgi:hypothetical protein